MEKTIKKLERRLKKYKGEIELLNDLIADEKKFIEYAVEYNRFDEIQESAKFAKKYEMQIEKYEALIEETKNFLESLESRGK